MSSQLVKWSAGLALFLWLFWVLITYLGFHPSHLALFQDYPYPEVLASVVLMLLILGGYSQRRLQRQKKWYFSFRGVHLILSALVIGLIFIFFFWKKAGITYADSGAMIFHYLANSLWYLLLLTVLGLSLMAIGSILSDRLGDTRQSDLFDIALGVMKMGVFSAFLGVFHLLYGLVLWVVLVGAVALKHKRVLATLKAWFWTKNRWRILHWWQLPVAMLGLFFMGIYWVGGIKAFAAGFDGAALYANLSELIADNNALPGAYQAFGWSVVMSWGKLLFGSLTMSILLSHFIYVPALALAYTLISKWLKAPYALLSIVLILSLPAIGFQAMVDEKVDFGLLFISLAAVQLVLQYDFSSLKEEFHWRKLLRGNTYYPFLILGSLLGFAFSIKYTAVFLIVAVAGLLFYRLGQSILFWGWLVFFTGFIFLSGFHLWGNLPLTDREATGLGAVMSAAGLGLLAYRLYAKRLAVRPMIRGGLVMAMGFLFVFSPWAGKHFAERDYQLSLSSFLYGKPDRIAIEVSGRYLSQNVNTSPLETGIPKKFTYLTSDQTTPTSDEPADDLLKEEEGEEKAMIGNAKREELQRYLGYEEGVWRYLTIPFDLAFNLNVPGLRHQQIGFFWLALLPLLFLVGAKRWRWRAIILGLGGFLYLAAAYWSLTEAGTSPAHVEAANTYLSQYGQQFTVTNQGAFIGFWQQLQQPFIHLGGMLTGVFAMIATLPAYVFIPLLLGVFFLLGLFFKRQAKEWPPALRTTGILLTSFLFLWLLLGNSITWYALLAVVLLPSCFIYFLQEASAKKTKNHARATALVIGSTLGLQLLYNTALLMSSTQPAQPPVQVYNWPMVEYLCSSDLNQEKTLGLFDPVSEQIVKQLNRGRDSRIYRVNTYLQFHIDKNNQRVLEDNQLQKFDKITSLIENPSDFVTILKENGFEYILYDLNTPSLDRTPERSLQAKCQNFLQLMVTSPQVELALTDNYVAAPAGSNPIRLPNGQTAVAQPGLRGNTVLPGRIALFRIK